MVTRLSPAELTELADTAFQTMNWARRIGFNRERQIEEVRKAFEVTLGYRKPVTAGVDDAG